MTTSENTDLGFKLTQTTHNNESGCQLYSIVAYKSIFYISNSSGEVMCVRKEDGNVLWKKKVDGERDWSSVNDMSLEKYGKKSVLVTCGGGDIFFRKIVEGTYELEDFGKLNKGKYGIDRDIWRLSFVMDGKGVVIASWGGHVGLFTNFVRKEKNEEEYKIVDDDDTKYRELANHGNSLWSMIRLRTQRCVVVGGNRPYCVTKVAYEGPKKVDMFPKQHSNYVLSLASSVVRGKELILSGGDDETVIIYTISGNVLEIIKFEERTCSFLEVTKNYFFVSGYTTIFGLNIETYKVNEVCKSQHSSNLWDVKWLERKKSFATASEGCCFGIFKIEGKLPSYGTDDEDLVERIEYLSEKQEWKTREIVLSKSNSFCIHSFVLLL